MERIGTVSFNDSRLCVSEDGSASRDWNEKTAWNKKFKKDVFKRIIQQLNRMGWTLEIPSDYIKDYGQNFASNFRVGYNKDLKCHLDLSDRSIELEFWQDLENIDHPSGGRYVFDKEDKMPYLIWLQMENTRNKIKNYLCNIFDGYKFRPKEKKLGINGLTALEWLQKQYAESWHFKGDLTKYKIDEYNAKSADKTIIQHGQQVWFFDRKGRVFKGTAYYNINNMWWVICGKYLIRNLACFEIRTEKPQFLRKKYNLELRRKCLEKELSKAIKRMDFSKAQILKNILFNDTDKIYLLWNKERDGYHCSSFVGYTKNPIDAGKFTLKELSGWITNGGLEDQQHKIVGLDEI